MRLNKQKSVQLRSELHNHQLAQYWNFLNVWPKKLLLVVGFSLIAVFLASAGPTLAASPVKPFTASELPVMATTPNLIYGAYGPQAQLNTHTFQTVPEPLYLEKKLETMLQKAPLKTQELLIHAAFSLYLRLPENQTIPLSNGTITLPQLQEQAKNAMAQCRNQGYLCDVTAKQVARQLRFELTPVRLSSVKIDVADARTAKALKHLLHMIQPGRFFRLTYTERQLRLIHANPDLLYSASLEVLPYTHQVRMLISSREKPKKLHALASVNNLDQVIFGRNFAGLTAVSNNLTGHGDSLMLGGVQGYRSTAAFLRYEYPFRPAWRGTLETQYGWISPFQSRYTDGDAHGFAFRITPGLKYTFYDRPNQRTSADLQFDFKQSRTYGNEGLLEREYVRNLRLGVNYDRIGRKTTFSTRHEVAAAFPIWKGSLADDPRLSWYKGGSQFFRYTGNAVAARQLPLQSMGILNFQWQYTPNGLSNFDVGGLGGTFYGRGYREIYYFVDRYAIVTGQWQLPVHLIPKRWKFPFTKKPLQKNTQLLTFVDYGYGQIASPPKGVRSNYQVFSTGVGLRSQLTQRIAGRLDVGFPIIQQQSFSQKPRLHFGLDILLH